LFTFWCVGELGFENRVVGWEVRVLTQVVCRHYVETHHYRGRCHVRRNLVPVVLSHSHSHSHSHTHTHKHTFSLIHSPFSWVFWLTLISFWIFRVIKIVTNHTDIQEYATKTLFNAMLQSNCNETTGTLPLLTSLYTLCINYQITNEVWLPLQLCVFQTTHKTVFKLQISVYSPLI
jgi:hypothetical protein